MTTDIKKAAQMEYQERMKQRLAETPLPLEYLIMQGQPITQEHVDTLQQAQRYQNRDRIPEPLLTYADLYNELTGQEPTKRVISDWLLTFNEWKDEKLTEDNIRMAWAQAQSDKGFTVGRPGALTVTAVGMKSKAKPALPAINAEAVRRTTAFIEERQAEEVKYVPMPDSVRERMREIRIKKLQEQQHGTHG